MKSTPKSKLHEELKSAGASEQEINQLSEIADHLTALKDIHNSSLQPRRTTWSRLIPIGLTSLTGLAIGMALVIFSQTVLPGSLLYPVQKLSDNIAMSVNSSYRGTVMMKRAQEVKQLIVNHASSGLVLATLSDYQTEASVYKSVSANYAAFEYCKSNLQQASDAAPKTERQAINNVLLSLTSV
jgi:hypothetical protein